MNWIGGGDDDIRNCRDIKDGASFNELELRYRADITRVLAWLSAPDRHRELAPRAVDFLRRHGTGIKMEIAANMNFGANGDEPLVTEWPDACESVVAPVCKFIFDQVERHDIGGEPLSALIRFGQCQRTGCDRFFMIQRAGRKQFCGPKCKARANQDKLSKEQKAALMRKHRANLKEQEIGWMRETKRKN